jgi:glycerophosphoryl diester phosphodiesterase
MPGQATPLIVAHRGAWDEAPQNSLHALAAAITIGCEMVEFDVRRTRDGHLVAVHDARVRGTPVAELDHEELRARLAPGQAPRLEEMVELSAGRITLDVELKEEGYVEQALRALRIIEPEQYVITSFLDGALAEVREAAPATRTGLLVGPGGRVRGTRGTARRRGGLEARLRDSGADFLGPHVGLARAGLLAWAARRGLETYVWTVNDRRSLRTLLDDARVSALITDRPAAALAARAELSRRACERPH